MATALCRANLLRLECFDTIWFVKENGLRLTGRGGTADTGSIAEVLARLQGRRVRWA